MGSPGSRQVELERGRTAYAECRWHDAYEALGGADGAAPLGEEDLEALCWSAALTGRDARLLELLERLYREHDARGRLAQSGRVAFWLGFRLVSMGQMGRAGGWLARAQRAVDAQGEPCATRGWLIVPVAHRHLGTGDNQAARDVAAAAVAVGESCGDRDLVAFRRPQRRSRVAS
jgi:hypothetical protein